MELPRNKIVTGDALAVLGTFPARSVHCVVCSPPYWQQRNYDTPGQIGLEKDPGEYVRNIVGVFSAVKEILRDDGTLWINLGDKMRKKELLGLPWWIALAMKADGWKLRQENIWNKPNPQIESANDRPTRAHEQVFLFSKSGRYYCDMEAIKEPASTNTHARGKGVGPKSAAVDPSIQVGRPKQNRSFSAATAGLTASRNKRTVWTIQSKPYPGAHFAVFPEDIPDICISAGTSETGVCSRCSAPYRRLVEKYRTFESGSGRSGNLPSGKNGPKLQGGGETEDVRRGPVIHSRTTGWQRTCRCSDWFKTVPAIVLDPFMGSGTTAAVAKRLGRDYVGIELNPEYVKLAEERLKAGPAKRSPRKRAPAAQKDLF